MRQRDPVEVAHLRLPPRDWNTLACDRCDRVAKVRLKGPNSTSQPGLVSGGQVMGEDLQTKGGKGRRKTEVG